MDHLLIIGANGQLGRSFQKLSSDQTKYQWTFLERSDLDLKDTDKIDTVVRSNKPDAVINCAAYTAVDRAEEDQNNAQLINATAVGKIATTCNDLKVPLFHYSSDYVYHNNLNRPLLETDLTTPAGVYAKTKLEGEQLVARNCEDHFILRTSWVYSPYGNNFVKTMLKLGSQRTDLKVVFDQIGAPTYAEELAKATLKIYGHYQSGNSLPGTYNFSNAGVCSWYDLAVAIFRLKGMKIMVEPVTTDAFPRPAPRPPYSVMNCGKFTTTFQMPIRHWMEALEDCLEQLPFDPNKNTATE